MKRLFVSSVFALTAIFSVPGSAQNLSQSDGVQTKGPNLAADTVDVKHVIDAYHQALVSHDGARLASLFLAQGGMWLNVLSDEAFALQKAKNPAALKVRIGNYADFAKQVSTARVNFNPTHTNLQENSDGTIASVYFDFVFLADGKETNRGSETWVLVKESDGWRIAGMTYSSNPPVH